VTDMRVYGVKETLNELRKFDRELFNDLRQQLKTTATPLAKAVGADFPDSPLSNWNGAGRTVNGFPRYSGSKAKKGVRVAPVRTSRRNPAILRIEQKDAAGAVFDGAGSKVPTPAGVVFARNLDSKTPSKSAKGRTRSRVMFPSTKDNLPKIERSVSDALALIEQQTQRRINDAGTR